MTERKTHKSLACVM